MSNLKFKTRGSTSPQGKPRVYFCCHPEDFDEFFEAVSDEILAKQSCAVWYTDDANTARAEDFFADLKQMQLFVIPVTTKLLCTENAALNLEFKFAIENHIPVLPLMQESGLEQIFNQKCGDLQFLDRNNTDGTAISYDEKLEKYLSSVLVGDELAEKIRAAFDAYVFLSYRKKDRKYAQELMRLIHKNEFCRDIAIWYDEFLTPGENFNSSIKEALEKSGLFVLTVTPNLVNEINYIMTTEYPLARQEGKPILPAELVPTDKQKLSESYEGIPDCTDAHNEAELSDALLGAIKKMAIKENDGSPEHNFFIGLAYLSGIDVEVDSDRALKLITSSAEAGLVEATDRLCDIYLNGIGVERDLSKAAYWKEYKLNQCRKKFLGAKTAKSFYSYYSATVELAEFYMRSLKNSVKALDFYLGFEQDISNFQISDDLTYITGRMYLNIGNCCFDNGDMEKAEEYTGKAEKIFAALSEKDDFKERLSNPEAIADITLCDVLEHTRTVTDLSLLYEAFATHCKQNGQKSKAGEYLLKVLQIRKNPTEIFQIKNNYTLEFNLIVAYINLSKFYVDEKNYNEAKKYIDEGLPLAAELASSSKTLYAGECHVILLDLRAEIHCAEGEVSKAKELYSLCIYSIEHSNQTPRLVSLLAKNYIDLGKIFMQENKFDTATQLLEKAKTALLAQNQPDTQMLAVLDDTFKDMKTNSVYIKGWVYYYDKLLEKSYAQNDGSAENMLKIIGIILKTADVYFEGKLFDEATDKYLSCLKFCKFLLISDRDATLPYAYLANKKIVDISLICKKPKQAKKHIKQLLKLIKIVSKAEITETVQHFLVNAFREIGDFYSQLNDPKKAQKYYKESLQTSSFN